MPHANPNGRGTREERDATLPMSPEEAELRRRGQEAEDDEPRFFENPKRIAQTLIIAIVAVAAIYFLFPQVVGVEDGIEKLSQGDPVWIAVAFALQPASCSPPTSPCSAAWSATEIQLRWRESYEITMAGLAATRLFSAGGAGGIVLTYWALRKAGMPPKDTAARMVAFNVLLYAVYMLTLLINGILLRTGVFSGDAPAGMTVVPAVIAGGVILIFLLITLVPGDLEKRFSGASQEHFWGRTHAPAGDGARRRSRSARARRSASSASRRAAGSRSAARSASGRRRSRSCGRPSRPSASIASLAVIVQGFFVGMFANLMPLPGGVGGVDAGMIGAFVLFGLPGDARLRGRARLPAVRLLAAAAAGDRRLLPAAADGPALGGEAGQPAGRQRYGGEPSRGHYFIK